MNIFRNILYMARRFKTATVLNFIGLTVAFAACYLFLTQVIYSHSYNKGLTNYEQLYRVEVPGMADDREWQSNVSRYIAEQLAAMPQVETMALMTGYNNCTAKKDLTEFSFLWCRVNNDALATFAPRLLDGDITWKDGDQKGLVIPASIAMQYFGSVQVAGRHMMWESGDSAIVRGVFADFPENSSVRNCIYSNMRDENQGNINNYNYVCYLRLNAQIDTAQVNHSMREAMMEKWHQLFVENGMEERWEEEKGSMSFTMRLQPITKTWYSGVNPELDKGNKTVDWILRLSCLLVIIIAAINFLNFVLAESPMRIKSVNTRRVLGSSLSSLRIGLIAETIIMSLMAFLMAMVICWLLSYWPFISELMVDSIALSKHVLLILVLALVAVLVGIVAGIYPAFYVTSFQPALVLKGAFGLSPQGRQLRTALLCLQFLITCIVVVYIGILYLQSHYIFNSDYGYSKDEILYANIWELNDKQDALRSELMQQMGVIDVAFSQFALGFNDTYMNWGRSDKDHKIQYTVLPVDCHYLRTMGIKVIEGRDFTEHDGDCYIINEAARKKWNWVEMDNKLLDDDLPVIGVCRNIRFGSTRKNNNDSPLAFIIVRDILKSEGWVPPLNIANVRVAAGTDKVQMRQKIKDICMKLGMQHEPEVKFLDQHLEELYQEEFRFMRQVLVFSVICLIITLIGVFCLTMFETEYRRKEIGIRKVMGSSVGEILAMLCRRYVWLLLISFVVAAPLAWHFGNQWLQSFAERTPIYWWLFPLALLAVGIITLATVIVQSWRTANENPVNSIKSE